MVSANPFSQQFGTAMGTSFPFVYANIHLIYVEANMVRGFCFCSINDGIILWHGLHEDFQMFFKAFQTIDPMITFD